MSSSPAASGDQAQASEQVHFRFCRECSNLLYPKEDRATNTLLFSCRTCHVSEPASSYCVFQNNLNTQVGDTAGVTQDVGSDPTVGLSCCMMCGEVIDDNPDDPLAPSDQDNMNLDQSAQYNNTAWANAKLPRSNRLCPSCGENEAVFFQSQQRSAETGMKLYYVCCTCGNVFT